MKSHVKLRFFWNNREMAFIAGFAKGQIDGWIWGFTNIFGSRGSVTRLKKTSFEGSYPKQFFMRKLTGGTI